MALTSVRCRELAEAIVRGTVQDDAGTPVPLSALTSATLSLLNLESNQVLNGWDNLDILNAHHVTIATDGTFRWDLVPLDNVIVNPRRQIERHRASFRFTWTDGASPASDGGTRQEIEILVENLFGAISPDDIATTSEHAEGSTWTVCVGTSPSRVCTTYTRDNGQDIPVAAVTY